MESQDNQFSLKSILWLTSCLALLIAYSQSMGEDAIRQLLLYAVFALVAGGVVGLVSGQLLDALYWSMVANLLVYLAVAGGRLPSEAVTIAWGGVGAACGSLCGAGWPKNPALGIIVSSSAAVLAATGILIAWGEPVRGLIWFDVACAAVIGLIFRPAIDYLKKLLDLSQQPRLVLAAWLSITILIGNLLVPIIGGVQR